MATPIQPPAEALVSGAQVRFANFSKAWTQLAHGMLTASLAEAELVRAALGSDPLHLATGWQAGMSREQAQAWLEGTRRRYDDAMQAWRRLNDEHAKSVFAAAETLIEGFVHDEPAEVPPNGGKKPRKPG